MPSTQHLSSRISYKKTKKTEERERVEALNDKAMLIPVSRARRQQRHSALDSD